MKEFFEGIRFDGELRFCETMSAHTTMKVGGRADAVLFVASQRDVEKALRICTEKGVPITVLGKGSNVIVSDLGIEGLTLVFGEGFSAITPEKDGYTVQAGAGLVGLCARAMRDSLCGLEFAEGIPGTVGGAVWMNAGAYGSEMSMIVRSVRCMTREGRIVTLSNQDCGFSYRHSNLMELGYIVLDVGLFLRPGNGEEIKAAMLKYHGQRAEKQPKGPSAGSFFKRPAGHFAGGLIEGAGLKGFSVGGAKVSEKHAGFIVNGGDATAGDIVMLKEEIQRRIQSAYSVRMEPEVRFIGRGF